MYRCTTVSLLRERTHLTRRELKADSPEFLRLHPSLAGELSTDDWDLIDRVKTKKVSHVAAGIEIRYCRKFSAYAKPNTRVPTLTTGKLPSSLATRR
jgi:hypothetical protein